MTARRHVGSVCSMCFMPTCYFALSASLPHPAAAVRDGAALASRAPGRLLRVG